MENNNLIYLIVGFIVIIIIVLLLLVSIPEKEETIKIGATYSLTGNLAKYGNGFFNALELAVEEVNSNGGINNKKLELIIYNDEGSPEKAVNNVNTLVNIHQVDFITFSSYKIPCTLVQGVFLLFVR